MYSISTDTIDLAGTPNCLLNEFTNILSQASIKNELYL